jgi:hypothetical protein
MEAITLTLGIIFSLFSALVLSYISIATMVGPWIAPTIVLLCHSLFWSWRKNQAGKTNTITAIQAIGAGGGIIATGLGFALPMLYFLDEGIFNSWLASPWYFCGIITLLCVVAGGLGLLAGQHLAKTFTIDPSYPFPVSKLTHNIITTSDHNPIQSRLLLGGIMGTTLLCLLRDGIWRIKPLLEKTYYLLPGTLGTTMALTIWPTLWAIGFSVGLPITLPLLIGLISKYVVIAPLLHHASYLPFQLFEPMSAETFTVAFCSGLIMCELLLSLPGLLVKQAKRIKALRWSHIINKLNTVRSGLHKALTKDNLSAAGWQECALVLVGSIVLLTYFQFSILTQCTFIVLCLMATYAICQIGCKIGMVPFGRFSTFIVVPLLLLFKLSAIQATIVCVFFNICAATASDLLFDFKTGDMVGIDRKTMYRYQWVGLLATSIGVGLFLWLLCTHLHLGSEALFAQRGKAKALLLQSLHFNHYIVGLGIAFGWLLKKFKINSSMVFGGLIMPSSVTFGLVIGSLGTLLTKNREKYQALAAGSLAAESLWVLLTILAAAL